MDMSTYLGVFIDESRELLDRAQAILRQANPDEKELYRLVHTLKGMSAAMNLSRLSELAHGMENGIEAGLWERVAHQLDHYQGLMDRLAVGQPMEEILAFEVRISPVLKGVRATLVLAALAEHGALHFSLPSLPDLEAERFGASFRVQLVTPLSWEELSKKLSNIPGVEGVKPVERVTLPELPLSPPSRRLRMPIRVAGEQLEELEHLLKTVMEEQRRLQGFVAPEGKPVLARVQATMEQLGALMGSLRKVPVQSLFNRFPRMVRELSLALGKEVLLRADAGSVLLDRRIVDELTPLLMHLLRNALDHALENPEERLKRGKPRQGLIVLSAKAQGDRVRIEVRDDGRGIVANQIRERLGALALLSPEEIGRLSDREALEWVFHPGFSTSDTVTRVSGRGMGMDIVRARWQELGGTVGIETVPGQGTTFRLDLVLS